MLNRIVSYLRHIPQLAGVEILLDSDERIEINVVVVNRNGSQVQFKQGSYDLTTYQAVSQHLPEGIPAVLALGGRGIMHRVVPGDGEARGTADLLPLVFPNSKADDFYLQHTALAGTSFLSIARRNVIDQIAAQLEGQGIPVLGVMLGAFPIRLFISYLRTGESPVSTWRHRFTYHADTLMRYELLPMEPGAQGRAINLAGEQLNERLAAAFAVAFTFISDLPWAGLPLAGPSDRATECRWQWQFKRTGIAIIAVLLLTLLGNVLYFTYYSEKVAHYAGNDMRAVVQEIELLEKQHTERSALLDGLLPAETPQWGMAFLADRIAGTCPLDIRLTELAIYPEDAMESRKQRRTVYAPSAIRIGGNCMDMSVLNEWTQQLRELSFCALVALETYQLDERSGDGVFSLSITLKP